MICNRIKLLSILFEIAIVAPKPIPLSVPLLFPVNRYLETSFLTERHFEAHYLAQEKMKFSELFIDLMQVSLHLILKWFK